eukprot:82714_1
MFIYLIIGSIVLLNLLIAMMAKTFDAAGEAQRIKMRVILFNISSDKSPAFIPPPLNLIVIPLVAIFYAIEYTVTYVLCRVKNSYDLLVNIAPSFRTATMMSLDEQILYHNCQKQWVIVTGDGSQYCKAINYDPFSRKHTIMFKSAVSLYDHGVELKSEWKLDLMELIEAGLMDVDQFSGIYLGPDAAGLMDVDPVLAGQIGNRFWKNTMELLIIYNGGVDNMKRYNITDTTPKNDYRSPYWTCGYCKAYVQESKVSLKNFGRFFNMKDTDVNMMSKRQPCICPNCWRVRFERKNRIYLVWETLSIWLFYCCVIPPLILIVGFLKLLKVISNPGQMFLVKSPSTEATVDWCYQESLVNYVADVTESLSRDHVIWKKIHSVQYIDIMALAQRIDDYILKFGQDELSRFYFYDGFINKDGIIEHPDQKENASRSKRKVRKAIWQNYFRPLAQTLFTEIKQSKKDYIPLHSFLRYPLDMALVTDGFQDFFDMAAEECGLDEIQPLNELNVEDIVKALEELKFLNCREGKKK